jgi:hypothetical protein
LADAHGSGPCTRKGVGVRVPSSAPTIPDDIDSRGCKPVSLWIRRFSGKHLFCCRTHSLPRSTQFQSKRVSPPKRCPGCFGDFSSAQRRPPLWPLSNWPNPSRRQEAARSASRQPGIAGPNAGNHTPARTAARPAWETAPCTLPRGNGASLL